MSETEQTPVAPYVEHHSFDLFSGDLIESVLVIGEVVDADGDQGVLIASGGMGTVDQMGLLECAKQILDQGWKRRED